MQYFRKLQLPIMFLSMICLLIPQSALVGNDCCQNQSPQFYCPVDYSKCQSSCFDYGTIGCIIVGALAGAGAGYAASDNNHHKGDTGKTGPQGPVGTKGDAGTNGTNGLNGAAGAAGTTGAQGATGATGSQGATGPAGASGSSCGCGLGGGDSDEGQSLTVTFTYAISGGTTANTTLIPFVVTPGGSIIQDSAFTITADAATETQTIVVSDPVYGTYLVGYNIAYTAAELSRVRLTTTVLSSREPSTTTLHNTTTPTGPSTGQIQVAENYIYSTLNTIP